MRGMDVAVLGGGPAGLAAALALRQRGGSVALYDAQHPPIEKACGEGLMPESVRILEELGVPLGSEDGAMFAGISFYDRSSVAHGGFSRGWGLGVRRTRLHSRMVERAAEAGIELHWGSGVGTVAEGGFAAAGIPIRADFFVIADGLCSTLARAAGFREQRCSSMRYASRQRFRCAPQSASWAGSVEVHWGHREQLYLTPIGENELSIALLTGTRGRRLRDALPDFPAVAQRLDGASCTSTDRGAVTKTRRLRQVLRGNIAVLGDASGSVDAITGEGLLSAFRQARALAEALAAGRPARYVTAHRHIARNPHRMARLLLLLDRHPQLRIRFTAALAAQPEVFAALLRVHLGEEGWPQATNSLIQQFVTRYRTHPWSALFAANGHHRERGL
jgi:flavin-dependent dehydrogenase